METHLAETPGRPKALRGRTKPRLPAAAYPGAGPPVSRRRSELLGTAKNDEKPSIGFQIRRRIFETVEDPRWNLEARGSGS